MEPMSYTTFLNVLREKAKDRGFKSKTYLNYPNSIFYYYADDNDMQNEIGIYTCETAYGIYI